MLVVGVELSNFQREPHTNLGQEGIMMAHLGKGQNSSLAQEEEDHGVPIWADGGSRSTGGKSAVGTGNLVEIREMRELDHDHDKESLQEKPRTKVTEGGNVQRLSPQRRRTKGLWEVGEPSTHPWRSVRIKTRSSQVRNSSSSKVGTLITTISNGDTNNCIHGFRTQKLWWNQLICGSWGNTWVFLVEGSKKRLSRNISVWK